MSFTLLALAFVDLLALAGGLLTLARAAKRVRRLWATAHRRSLAAAARRARLTFYRQALKCASDVQYYQSRLALLFSVSLLTVAGVLFAAIAAGDTAPSAGLWEIVASVSMVLFAALAARTLARTLRLTRKVMEIRTRRRAAAARYARHARAGEPRGR